MLFPFETILGRCAYVNNEKLKGSRAYEELKALLKEERIDKNRIIPTSEIAETLQMGRAPVLEALKKLESEKYVRIIPQKGVMVREMTIQDMREINDVRIALEGFLAAQVAPSFSSEDAETVKAMLDEQKAAEAEGNPRRFIKSDEAFHLYICAKSGNSLLVELMQSLRERFFTAGLYILMKPNRMQSTLEEHSQIADALSAHDADFARAKMIAHIESGKKRLV
jgi:DNA-binding GntR family transcriptional regulator